MVDPKDAIVDARARIKKLAASMLVRKEALEAELAKLVAQRDEARAASGVEGAEELLAELEAQVSAKEEELAICESDLKGALGEIGELGKLEGQSERAALRAIVDGARGGDPLIRTPAERALDNVRDHIADLDAQARLTPASTPAPAKRGLTEDEARQKLEELKAAKRKKLEGPPTPRTDPTDLEGSANEDAEGGALPPTKPKRTL